MAVRCEKCEKLSDIYLAVLEVSSHVAENDNPGSGAGLVALLAGVRDSTELAFRHHHEFEHNGGSPNAAVLQTEGVPLAALR
jgi:hypothetical protein